jgi:hypothetical protein
MQLGTQICEETEVSAAQTQAFDPCENEAFQRVLRRLVNPTRN